MRQENQRSRESSSRDFGQKNWRLPLPLDPGLVERLSREAGVIPEVASVLLRRAGSDSVKALALLPGPAESGRLPSDLFAPPGMREAVLRLARARDSGERVIVYSDFDCDGVTSAVVLKEALELARFDNFDVYFPSRILEGYGFHADSARALAEQGASLFVTADCGISGQEACEVLARLGRDVIITDHHLPPAKIPEAVAVIDPHLPLWRDLGLTGLSGAGVAYLLARALLGWLGVDVPVSWAHDLLALSIAGDGQPVLGPNRAWIRSGLRMIADGSRVGIQALLRAAGLDPEDESRGLRRLSFDRDVLFGLVPRINAAGRLADPRLAFELLCTNDVLRATALADELNQLNQQRREIEDRILEECRETLLGDRYALCAYRPGWHEGVIGVACSRVREIHRRPAVLVGGEGDVLKGSVRGVPGFNVVAALERCRDLLDAFGGHEGAGGFSIRKELVDEFFHRFDLVSAEMLEEARTHDGADVDEVLAMRRVTEDTLRAFLALDPFGEGNPMPQMACMDCETATIGLMGASQGHLQVVLSKEGVVQRFLWFGQGGAAREIAMWGTVDALFTPYRNVYRGQEQVSPLLRDMRPSWAMTGLHYRGLAGETPGERPVILYTWSEEAAQSLWVAFRKEGRPARLHRSGQAGAEAREARAALRESGGVVISTAPWDLGLKERAGGSEGDQGRDAGHVPWLGLVHPPVDRDDLSKLRAFSSAAGAETRQVQEWRQDAALWLSWQYPEEDRMRALWKLLSRSYRGGRVPLWELGCRWSGILEAAGFTASQTCFEGGRLFLKSSLCVFEEVGLATYDQSRRAPEIVLHAGGGKVDLQGSRAYVAGEQARENARRLWDEETGV
jgi:single-stranded-DNA-specific exonuclease